MKRPITWRVEKSHFFRRAPEQFVVSNIRQLMKDVQRFCDDYDYEGIPLGKLEFNIEHDSKHKAVLARAYFKDQFGENRRFMRLRRIA